MSAFGARCRIIALTGLLSACFARAAQDRITAPIDDNLAEILIGSVHPGARAEYDRGTADPDLTISCATLLIRPSPAQQAELDRLWPISKTAGPRASIAGCLRNNSRNDSA